MGTKINPSSFTVLGSADSDIEITSGSPEVSDPNLKIEEVVEGLELPTSIAFLGPDDILVLEKDNGIVRRIVGGQILPDSVLDVNVANENERGMLGIAVGNSGEDTHITTQRTDNQIHVYLTFTESEEQGSDVCSSSDECEEGTEPVGNRLYRYEFVNDALTDPQLLLDLPATPGPAHNGGVIVIGPDDNVYVTVGDIRALAQNSGDHLGYDGRAGILRVTPDGQPVGEGILGKEHPLNFYYAYGIRNSFGVDFDPVTGNLWDTENGRGHNEDELNLVLPGFNSGWEVIQGLMENEDEEVILDDFDGKGKYRDPEFVWGDSVGPTALKFLNSDKLGEQYQNDMFVGDVHLGNLYHFELNKDRTGLVLDNPDDRLADEASELEEVIFGRNFGGITDVEVGPDGYLYIVSIGAGKIFRIVPATL